MSEERIKQLERELVIWREDVVNRANLILHLIDKNKELSDALSDCLDEMGGSHPGANSYWDAVHKAERALGRE